MGALNQRTALVTGSSRGIGRAVALKLADAGAGVVVNGMDAEAVKSTVSDIEAGGGQAVACVGNVTDADFARRFIDTAVNSFGGIDIIVNNAGYVLDSVIQKMTDQQWHEILDVHLSAPFRILRAAQPIIKAAAREEAARGAPRCRKVVNVSSIAGVTGNSGQVNYAAAKAGLAGVSKSLSKEWGRYNVTVNTIAFGLIETRTSEPLSDVGSTIDVAGKQIAVGVNPGLLSSMKRLIPLGRMGTPEEAAGAVYMFCSPESDYITGQTVVCSGGLMM